MKVTVLAENTIVSCEAASAVEAQLLCEHGLSFYIEYDGKTYLLDAGQSDVFARNAKLLGLDLAHVDAAVLSHAHYDHAGGFGAFFEQNKTAPVYACAAGRTADCRSVAADGTNRSIGIPVSVLEEGEDRFAWTDGVTEIGRGVYLVPHSTEGLGRTAEKTGMYRMEQGRLMPDDFAHEQSLVFVLPQGLVIFNSCSHGGVVSITEEVRRALPGRPIFAFLGGFHLKAPERTDASNCTEEEIETLGRSLLALGVEELYTGHCTGVHGYEILKRTMGEKLRRLYTGAVMQF